MMYVKRRKGWKMCCVLGEAMERLENELWGNEAMEGLENEL